MNFPNNSNPSPFNYMNSQNGNQQGGQGGFPPPNQGFPNQGNGFPTQGFPQQGSGQGFPQQAPMGQPQVAQPNQQGYPQQQGYPNPQQGYNVPPNQPYPGYPDYYNQQHPNGVPPGYYGQQTPPQPPQEPEKKKKKKKKQKEVDVFTDPNLSNSYKGVEYESMEEYYQYKESRKKLYILLGLCSILFVFILGAFSTQFINGDPVILTEESREILSYSDDVKDKTEPLFLKDRQHYDFANGLANQTIGSNVESDTEISKEIAKMESLVDDLKKMDKAKQVPVGFEGDAGLHQQLTGLLEMRIKLLGNIRQISQGQRGQINKFNEEFVKYVKLRNSIIGHFNQKYEYNFHTGLYDTKELEF